MEQNYERILLFNKAIKLFKFIALLKLFNKAIKLNNFSTINNLVCMKK